MANVGTHAQQSSKVLKIVGIAGVDDNDIVIEVTDASKFDEFIISSTLGVMDVDVSLDGTNFIAAIALEDRKSLTPATRVVVTVAAGLYSFNGPVQVVRVRQNTATDVISPVMICKSKG